MLYLFAIYDSAGSFYKDPFVINNKGIALREFADACNNKETFLFKHPMDYTLFELGTFDPDNGKFDILPTPVSLGKAIDYLKRVADPKEGFSSDDRN